MEARGIEPRSEPRSQTVSTCVDCALSSQEAGTQPSNLLKSSLKSRVGYGSDTLRQPDFPIPTRRLRRAATWAGAKQFAYAARAKSVLAVVFFFPVVYPGD